jgi:hypothetical protein
MKMIKTVKRQEPKPHFAIEQYVDEFGKVHPELVKFHVNEPLTGEARHVDAHRAIADIHPGMTLDSLLDSGLGHGIDRKVGRELIATNRMGGFFS